MSTTESLVHSVPQLRRSGSRTSVTGRRTASLYLRVVVVNASILVAAVLVLVLTPATISSQTAGEEGGVLALVLVVMVGANALLLRVAFGGLTALVRQMETLDVLQPRERLPQMGTETRALVTGFNAMLDRLEDEQLASTRRMVSTLEGERRRIGQELHDEIGQRLTGILLQLGRIRAEAPDSLLARIAGVQSEARATLDEVGTLAWQVRPGVLEDLGLLSALEALADSLRDVGSTRVDTAWPDRLPRMTSEVELAVYRVAQEALTNAVRHSGATVIQLELRLTRQDLVLQVTDNGRGLTGGNNEGLGLRGMRERALLVRGGLRVESRPSGVEVVLAVPADLVG